MEVLTYILIGVIFAAVVFSVGIVLYRSRLNAHTKGEDRANEQGFVLLQSRIDHLTKVIDDRLGETHKEISSRMQAQFGESTKIIREVTERLTKLDETNRQVVNFADQLQNLQDILKNPKQRGTLGEYYLETVLKNVLPPGRFALQYEFENGDRADAVIFLDKDKILPVDSKFSLENYSRILDERDPDERVRLEKLFKQDLKNRIDETAKYIRPKENTLDYAFMFIPSEAIYYDLLINKVGAVNSSTRDLIEYAFRDKRVIIASPTTFMAYLQTVLQGLRALQIEESAKEIRKRVEELGRHLHTHEEYMHKLGNSLSTTVSHYNRAHKELKKVDKDVMRVADSEPVVDPLALEKPVRDDE